MSAAALASALVLALAPGAHAPLDELREVRRAVETADLRGDWEALGAARERALRLARSPGLEALARYEAGYADWRMSSLAYLGAGSALQTTLLLRSARELQAATTARPDLADAHALLAWVSASALGADATRAAALAPLIGPAWKAASGAIATNPRVALLRAMATTFTPAEHGGDRARGLEAWKSVIARFEARGRPSPDEPAWGHAEALAWLGAAYLGSGEPEEATRWLERALAVRRDFWWVSRIALPQARRHIAADERPVAPVTATGASREQALRGIEALRQKDEAASRAHDLTALSALWTDDVVTLPPGGPVLRAPELRASLGRIAEAARNVEILTYRESFEETLLFGDAAVEWGHIEGSERDRTTGRVTDSRFHLMRILKRMQDGSWRVHRSIFAPAEAPTASPPADAPERGGGAR